MLAFAALLAAVPLDRAETAIEASLSDDLTRLTLVARTRYTPGEAIDAVPIVLAAERYRHMPALTPAEVREAFPRGFSPGGLDDLVVTVDGVRCDVPPAPIGAYGETMLLCPRAVAASQTVEVESRATLIVPERYGGFGKVGRQVTLAGGWFPQVARPKHAPPRGPWTVQLELPATSSAVIGERYRPSPGSDGRRTITAVGEGAQIPLVVRPAGTYALSIAEGRARFLGGRASENVRNAAIPTLGDQVRAAIEDGLRLAAQIGLPEPTPQRPLILIEAPLRHALTESAEGMVLVSDHAFRMIEVDRFLRFHRLPLLGDAFACLAARALGPEVIGRGLSADVAGAYALDRYVVARYGGAEDAFDVLGIVSFIPSIDQLLYAPDLAFAGAYFRNVPEAHPLKPDFLDFPLDFPRGHHVYEKLRDQIGRPRAEAIVARTLKGEGLIAAIERGWPEGAPAFLATWLGPYPAVRYQLGPIASAPQPGGGFRAEATIERVGDAIAEPVTVRFEDVDGNERLVTASATTARLRTVSATLAEDLDLVEIDPARRLVETPDADAPDPRYFHRSEPEWKVLLNNFNVLFAATEGSIETALDLGIARRNDVHWSFGVRGEYAAEAISLGARATYAFGGRVNGARLSHAIGLSSEAAYLRPGFAGAVDSGAAVLVGLSYGYDDRVSIWAPETGSALPVAGAPISVAPSARKS